MKKSLIILVPLLILVLGSSYYATKRIAPIAEIPHQTPPDIQDPGTQNPEPVFCTMEAKMCPDGSYVGRTGPKCEFAACPVAKDHSNLIKVSAPLANATVKSPLTVTGQARGGWYFEASFPVYVYDANGTELAVAPAQAQGEWMTTEFVPFSVKLTFSKPTTKTGTVVLRKDNPSGLPENDDSITIPVSF